MVRVSETKTLSPSHKDYTSYRELIVGGDFIEIWCGRSENINIMRRSEIVRIIIPGQTHTAAVAGSRTRRERKARGAVVRCSSGKRRGSEGG